MIIPYGWLVVIHSKRDRIAGVLKRRLLVSSSSTLPYKIRIPVLTALHFNDKLRGVSGQSGLKWGSSTGIKAGRKLRTKPFIRSLTLLSTVNCRDGEHDGEHGCELTSA